MRRELCRAVLARLGTATVTEVMAELPEGNNRLRVWLALDHLRKSGIAVCDGTRRRWRMVG